MPVHERTRSLACKNKKHASKSPQARRNIRHSLHDGLAVYTCSPRCPGLLATVAGVMREHHRQRDPSVGGSGPHDFAARLAALVLRCAKRPSHPAPNVRDDRDTPLFSGARRAGF
jgi:hypothetical protein